VAEVGDIGRFDNPKQLQKLAQPLLKNDYGKYLMKIAERNKNDPVY
jgi:hypothetical protein